MSRIFNPQSLIIALLVVVLAGLFIYGRTIDQPLHERMLHITHNIIEDDGHLSKNILLARLGTLRHYDSINRDFQHMLEEYNELTRLMPQIFSPVPVDIRSQLKTIKDVFSAKEESIERFKTANAVLRNSLMYFTLISFRLTEKLDDSKADGHLAQQLGNVSIQVLYFYRNPNERTQHLLDLALSGLKGPQHKRKYRADIEDIITHGRLLSEQIEKTDAVLTALTALPFEKEIYKIINIYHKYYEKDNARAAHSKWMTSMVAFILLFYLIYLFTRLRLSAAQVEKAKAVLVEEKELAEITLGSIADGVITTDSNGLVKYMNPIAEHLTGWKMSDSIKHPIMQVFHAVSMSTHHQIDDPVRRCLGENNIILDDEEYILHSRSGQENIIRLRVAPIRDENQNVHGAVMVFHDISETHNLIKHISHQARHDALTGLVNRIEFEHELQEVIRQCEHGDIEHALCFLDLDQFKIVNDTCGHIAGDELLKQLSRLLQDNIRASDMLARLGGDEFGLLLHSCSLQKAQQIAEQLREAIRSYRFAWINNVFDIGVSIGLVPIYAGCGGTVEVMSKADVACYAAKDLGRNRIHVYTESDEELLKRHSEMHTAASISKAIADNSFEIYVQRIKPVVQRSTDVLHYEVLIRMKNNEGNTLLPGAFIPAAERYNLMAVIDKWCIDESFKLLSQLNRDTHNECPVYEFSINISGNSIGDVSLKNYILDCVRQYNIRPHWVCFEVTETSAVANLNDAIDLIEALRAAGFKFSLDDFGSGMSSFTYLKTLNVDFLKIDGAFVSGIVASEVDFAMVESINHIGHVMGMATIAEFVEDEATLIKLQQLQVDYVQGYGIEEPKPALTLLGRNKSHYSTG